MDETKGTKTNRVTLNLAQHANLEAPEPGIAAVMIDGRPIHAVHYIAIVAAVGELTKCTISFECEVSGTIDGSPLNEFFARKAH